MSSERSTFVRDFVLRQNSGLCGLCDKFDVQRHVLAADVFNGGFLSIFICLRYQRSKILQPAPPRKVVPHKMMMSVKKWCNLTYRPNHKKSRYWSVEFSLFYEDGHQHCGEELLCWMGIIGGRILALLWFEEHGS